MGIFGQRPCSNFEGAVEGSDKIRFGNIFLGLRLGCVDFRFSVIFVEQFKMENPNFFMNYSIFL